MLVKQLPVTDIENCRPQHVPTNQKIRHKEHGDGDVPRPLGQNARFGENHGNKKQNPRAENAEQVVGLLPR